MEINYKMIYIFYIKLIELSYTTYNNSEKEKHWMERETIFINVQ